VVAGRLLLLLKSIPAKIDLMQMKMSKL